MERKGSGLTQHWNKEQMAVPDGPHVANSKAASGYFIDGQDRNTQERQKLSHDCGG